MQITYACPGCDATVMLEGVEQRAALECPSCHAAIAIPAGALHRTGAGRGLRLTRCLVCPSHELFARKDFPQRLGVAIVVAGFAASCVAWAWQLLVPTFAILFATALVDVLLYLFMPECLTCYRCQSRYRGDDITEAHGGFDLETHEKHRQGRARAAELTRSAATATAGPPVAAARDGAPPLS